MRAAHAQVQFGWIVSWFYLRFLKYNEGVDFRGDRSETFAFHNWFPPLIQCVARTVTLTAGKSVTDGALPSPRVGSTSSARRRLRLRSRSGSRSCLRGDSMSSWAAVQGPAARVVQEAERRIRRCRVGSGPKRSGDGQSSHRPSLSWMLVRGVSLMWMRLRPRSLVPRRQMALEALDRRMAAPPSTPATAGATPSAAGTGAPAGARSASPAPPPGAGGSGAATASPAAAVDTKEGAAAELAG